MALLRSKLLHGKVAKVSLNPVTTNRFHQVTLVKTALAFSAHLSPATRAFSQDPRPPEKDGNRSTHSSSSSRGKMAQS